MRDDFRLDIQGLRAFAILAVLIFHIDATKLPGGYIGVDIFFVISGFLITGHIYRDLVARSFSFAQFYRRRIRRLFPALFVTLIATAIGVYFIYLPQDARVFGEALISTSIYASNIYFYTQSDYFDAKLHTNPLLHTWSLSVEEQFYILFPVVLFFVYKYASARLALILAAIGILSFAASESVLRLDQSAAFFMMPTRLGQFMAGAIIALAPATTLSRKIREGLSWTGLGMLGASVIFISGKMPFPGFIALIPTIGAAMVIYAGKPQDLIASRLLSLWPAQFFGKISYSLYLWHWPIILFYKYHFASEIRGVEKITVGIVCIVAGYLSYILVEKPGLKISLDRPVFRAAALCSVIGIITGAAFTMTDGFKNRFSADEIAISSYLDYILKRPPSVCTISSQTSDAEAFDAKKCLAIAKDKKNILLLGDSHADHLSPAIHELFPDVQVSQATSSGCRPLLDSPGEKICVDFREKVFREMIPGNHYDAIIVSGRWRDIEAPYVAATIEFLKPHADMIVVSGPVIEYSASLPKLMALSLHHNDGGASIDKARKFDKIRETDRIMEEEVKKTGVHYFSPFKTLCDEETRTCRTSAAQNVPVQFDYGHMTKDGAVIVVERMKVQYFQGY